MTGIRSVLVAPDGFKDSLPAGDVARAIADGIADADPDARTELLPLADGGEGTLEAFAAAAASGLGPAELRVASVTGPLGEPREAHWLHLPETQTGVVEMARASGIELVPPARRDPLVTTTRGTGELVLAALDAGVRTLLVSIGGSATVDGGTGMARALGFGFLDEGGRPIPEGGGALADVARVTVGEVSEPVRSLHTGDGAEIIGLVDVDNPLTGPHGAAAVYGPQKGADPAAVVRLDAGLDRLAAVVARDLGGHAATIAAMPGAGAAGGLGAGLVWFLGARLKPGADSVLDAMRFDERLESADLVVTGEGRVDGQTARGKVVAAVAKRARRAGVPVWVLAGTTAPGWEEVVEVCGVERVETIARPGDEADERAAMIDAPQRLRALAASLYRARRAG